MPTPAEAIDRLLTLMAHLRGPDGCPWDREQTLASLRPYVLEETYEVLEAIDGGDPREHCEELGDLLLQIVFQAQLAKEAGSFAFEDVAEAISNKLVSRHPHVFGPAGGAAAEDGAAPGEPPALPKDAEGVLRQWSALKNRERAAKGRTGGALDGVPRALPALARADRLAQKASRVGFDWPDPSGPRAKVDEELRELDEAIASGDREAIEHEVGDALFALANLARKLSVPPEEALRGSVQRFKDRFEHVERRLLEAGIPHGQATLERMEELWCEAKGLATGKKKTL